MTPTGDERIPAVILTIKVENLDEVGDIAREILRKRAIKPTSSWFLDIMKEADLIRRRRASWRQRTAQ